MRLRSVRAVTLVAAWSLLALPAQAQDTASSVVFDGIGFTFGDALGSSVSITRVPGEVADGPVCCGGPDTPHVTFTLYGEKREDARTPDVGAGGGVVRVYPASGLAGNEHAVDALARLTGILADRPDLATFGVPGDSSSPDLPHLPVVPAEQGMLARAAYVDLPGLAGVRYITTFTLAAVPFVADDFVYTFQGLTDDGLWYVSAEFRVRPNGFPDKIGRRAERRLLSSAARYTAYLRASVAKLDAATPESFTPSLAAIDALVASLTVDAIPTSSPAPAASPAG